MDRGQDFAGIVYTLLVVEKVKRVEQVADALGLSYAALHARLINRTCFSADEIRILIRELRDYRLVDYLMGESGYIAVRRPEEPKAEDGSIPADLLHIQRSTSQVVISATDVLEIIDAGIAGGRIDHRITQLALQAILATERALSVLRLLLSSRG